MKTFQISVAALLLSLATAATAQDLQNQLIGTWDFVVAQVKAPDGKISFPFRESPKGMLVFTPDGRFMQIHVASDVPRIAANNRLKGTPEEYSEIMRRSISVFGTYSIDEAKKTVTYHIVSASFPNWQGESQTRTIDKLTADEFINTNPNVAGGRGSASNFYRRAK
jgi:lipocalin-like protein